MKRLSILTAGQRVWVISLSLLLVLMSGLTAVYAHEGIEIGPFEIVVGWRAEPPLVGERNALTFEILKEEQPFSGAEANLNIEVVYGGKTFHANLNPTAEPGVYEADIWPTVRGQYEVRLIGSLEETAVDVTVQPEEVFAADRLQFPQAQPATSDLQTSLTDLQSQLQTTRLIAFAGLGLGLIGLILGAISLTRSRKS